MSLQETELLMVVTTAYRQLDIVIGAIFKARELNYVYETDADPGFGQGESQPPRPKVADVAEQSHLSKLRY